MVTMTPTAAEQFGSFLKSSGIQDGAVRLFLTGGGCCGPGFAVDVVPLAEAGEDVPVVQDGTTLYVQKEAAELLENVVIDFDQTFLLRGLQSSGCCG
ncbi:MAG: HesB/IscA family protein [Acidobacteriota bacterium]